jgi:hypothetical protein
VRANGVVRLCRPAAKRGDDDVWLRNRSNDK